MRPFHPLLLDARPQERVGATLQTAAMGRSTDAIRRFILMQMQLVWYRVEHVRPLCGGLADHTRAYCFSMQNC